MKYRNSYEFVKNYLDYVISIEDFIKNYLDGDYELNYRLTHDELRLFFEMKNLVGPKRFVFELISDDDILSGKYLFVRDKKGKVIPYVNPIRCEDLIKNLCNDPLELSKRREALLSNDNCNKSLVKCRSKRKKATI